MPESAALAPESLLYEHDRESGVATVTLNRPERLNALTFEVYRELREVFLALDTEPGVGAVVLTGSGRAFCSGGDVEEIIGPLFERDYRGLLDFTRSTGDLVLAILRCRRPVVAALNGTVAGAGAVIASACDLRIASERAKIAFLFTKVGLSGADMGASWLLPRLVGHGRAMELLLEGEFLDAAEAYRIGLYNAVVPDEELARTARERAEKLARGPAFGLEITKRMLVREAAMDVESAMAAETEIQAACMLDPNFREAYEAFVDRRRPEFDTQKSSPPEPDPSDSEHD
jgi:enoyl-CoA hydratase/carnithine racemase